MVITYHFLATLNFIYSPQIFKWNKLISTELVHGNGSRSIGYYWSRLKFNIQIENGLSISKWSTISNSYVTSSCYISRVIYHTFTFEFLICFI